MEFYVHIFVTQSPILQALMPLHCIRLQWPISQYFQDQSNLITESAKILNHLYEQSDHPNIKTGELYVAFFRDIQSEDEMLNGIGIFKTEKRSKTSVLLCFEMNWIDFRSISSLIFFADFS